MNASTILEQVQRLSGSFESIEVLSSTKSTNTYLLEKPIQVGSAKVCICEAQTLGRGRRGNEWLSAPNKNIMMSLSWGFERWPQTITGLGLAVALVVAERLNKKYQIDVGIKWPNDLLINNEKLAGVLVEVTGNVDGVCNVVLGLGLNVHQPDWSKDIEPNSVRTSKNYAWTDLFSQGVFIDRNDLVASIISDWILMLQQFEEQGFDAFVERWNSLSCHAGKIIELTNPDGQNEIFGRMLGVNDIGALLVESQDGHRHVVNDTNMSLRLAN